jgi:hypothetical protein
MISSSLAKEHRKMARGIQFQIASPCGSQNRSTAAICGANRLRSAKQDLQGYCATLNQACSSASKSSMRLQSRSSTRASLGPRGSCRNAGARVINLAGRGSSLWLKSKNPEAPAVRRLVER